MPPRSPPMAFLPSPSAPVLQRSPERTHSPASSQEGHTSAGRLSNGIHSLASPPVMMSQSMSRQSSTSSATATSSASNVAMSSYMEQTRAFLQKQRKAIEDERALFAEERALWEAERAVLQARIKELEWSLDNGKPASGGDYGRLQGRAWEHRGTFGTSMAPNGSLSGEKFWEGPSSRTGSVATRTFSETSSLDGRLQSISEASPPPILIHPDSDISPGTNIPSHGIDISLVNDKLDGITLKATAVPPAVLSTLSSPEPSDPTEAARLKDAGHTPRPAVPLPDGQVISGGDATPTSAHQLHVPSADIDTLPIEPEDDPALKHPLSLNGSGKDDTFLEALDNKLEDVIRKSQESSPMVSPSEEREEPNFNEGKAEPEVKLRFKRSMNFGTVFGQR